MTKAKKGEKESLELLGVKISPALKQAIEAESAALDIGVSTYARQLLIVGWRSRHEAPVAKNPREQILIDRFNELPVSKQEDVVTMVEALLQKHKGSAVTENKVTPTHRPKEEQPAPPAPKITQSAPRKRDSIDEILDSVNTDDGGPLSEADRETIRKAIEESRTHRKKREEEQEE